MKTMKKTMKKTTKITTRAMTKITAFVLAFAFFAMAAGVVFANPQFQVVPGHRFYRQCVDCLIVMSPQDSTARRLYSLCEETEVLTRLTDAYERWTNCKNAPFQAISGGPPRPAITFPENVPPDSVRIVPTFTPIAQEPPVPPRGVWRAPLAGEPLDYSIWYGVIRSAIVMPQRELTSAELQIWVDEYWELGGKTPFEFEVVRLINEFRATYWGLEPLRVCPILSMAARYHSHQMRDQGIYQCPRNPARSQGFFAHRNPVTGTTSLDRAKLFDGNELFGMGGEGRLATSENLYSGIHTPETVVQSWINSPGHRAALLGGLKIGIGAVIGGGTTFKLGW